MRSYLLLIILLSVSCQTKPSKIDLVQYLDGKQLLTLNELKRSGEKLNPPGIVKLSSDSVLVGEELLVKIFLAESNLEIVDAFVDCESVAKPAVDTVTHKVSGCSQGLIVQNDTILIGFRPTKPGVRKFSDVTILTRDKEKVFRTFKYSFDYKVFAQPQSRL